MKIKYIFFTLTFVINIAFGDVYFVFDKAQDKKPLEFKKDKLEGNFLISKETLGLINKAKLKLEIKKIDDHLFILKSNTLPSNDLTAVLYQELKKIEPSLYFVDKGTSSKIAKQTKTKIITVEKPILAVEQSSDYTIWIALFGLAIIGILALSLSSFQVQEIIKKHKKIRQKHEEMEQKINEMFSMMGENIHKLSKDIVKYTSDILDEAPSSQMKNKLKRVVSAESRVLDSATNLLNFLYLKAKKIKVKKEQFNINVVLDDMVGNLAKAIKREDIEIIFDIDKSMPKFVIGDFVHISDIFSKILEHAVIVSSARIIKVDFSSSEGYDGILEFQANITYHSFTDIADADAFFIPIYNEAQNYYDRLGLYVSRELVKLMGGDITVKFEEKEHQYLIGVTIPLEESPDEERRKYHLSDKDYIKRDILIVNQNYEASLALKKLFSYFKHKTKALPADKFEKSEINFDNFDILMIEESLIDDELVQKIKPHRSKLKVISLNSVFVPFVPTPYKSIIDIRARKPMTQERAWTLIEDLYLETKIDEKDSITVEDKDQNSTSKEQKRLPVREFKSDIPETPNVNLKSFLNFKDAKVMIVEDNIINIKMILKVLENSQMDIITAQNGQEAVDLVLRMKRDDLDLILMDINMPIMDGYMATKKIRQIDGFEDLPIIALSALSLENEFNRMKNSGMDAYIPKPLNIGKLYTVFNDFLKNGQNTKIYQTKKELPQLKGIDIEVALEHVNDNEILLKEILGEFVNVYGNSDEEIARLFQEKRELQLKNYLFDIVGLASTIGAKDLAHYAQEMRKLFIYNKLELFPDLLKDYSNSLRDVKDSLDIYLKS
jgi:CheY-like chemotaxis protein/HPt (histidine-containing phosphotransfer) domain-containing protein